MGALEDIQGAKKKVTEAGRETITAYKTKAEIDAEKGASNPETGVPGGTTTTGTNQPSLTYTDVKKEEEKKQEPGSPLGVRRNAEREKLEGTTGKAGANAAASRSSLRVSTPTPTIDTTSPTAPRIQPKGIGTQYPRVNMDGDAENASRSLGRAVQHAQAPVEMASYSDILRYYSQPLTAEELAEEKRKQERNERLARVGDAIGAFHDAYSYARGVKPLERANMSAKSRERYEKMRAEWIKDRESYVNAALKQKAEQRADANAESLRKYRESMQQAKEREIKAREENNTALRELKQLIADRNEEHKKVEEKRKQEETEQRKKESESRINKNNRTGTGKSGGRSSGGTTIKDVYKEDVYDKNTGVKVGTHTRTVTNRGGSSKTASSSTGTGSGSSGGKKKLPGNGNSASTGQPQEKKKRQLP